MPPRTGTRRSRRPCREWPRRESGSLREVGLERRRGRADGPVGTLHAGGCASLPARRPGARCADRACSLRARTGGRTPVIEFPENMPQEWRAYVSRTLAARPDDEALWLSTTADAMRTGLLTNPTKVEIRCNLGHLITTQRLILAVSDPQLPAPGPPPYKPDGRTPSRGLATEGAPFQPVARESRVRHVLRYLSITGL